jgi:hypothetical protein
MTRITLENAERTCRPPGLGWIQHPDKRRFAVARCDHAMNGDCLTASRAGEVMAYQRILDGEVGPARAALAARVAALPSVYLDPPAPPILSRIDRIRELTAWVAELDQCEARAVELRGLIEGAAL